MKKIAIAITHFIKAYLLIIAIIAWSIIWFLLFFDLFATGNVLLFFIEQHRITEWSFSLLISVFFILIVLILVCSKLLKTKAPKTNAVAKATILAGIFIFATLLSIKGGVELGKKRYFTNIEYNVELTKRLAEPIIQSLDNYARGKGKYPETLDELNIPIPDPLVGGGKFQYFANYDTKGKPNFCLSFDYYSLTYGGFITWSWVSDSREWSFQGD